MVKRRIDLWVAQEDYEDFLIEQGATEEEIKCAKEEDNLEELVIEYLEDYSPRDCSPFVETVDETW